MGSQKTYSSLSTVIMQRDLGSSRLNLSIPILSSYFKSKGTPVSLEAVMRNFWPKISKGLYMMYSIVGYRAKTSPFYGFLPVWYFSLQLSQNSTYLRYWQQLSRKGVLKSVHDLQHHTKYRVKWFYLYRYSRVKCSNMAQLNRGGMTQMTLFWSAICRQKMASYFQLCNARRSWQGKRENVLGTSGYKGCYS